METSSQPSVPKPDSLADVPRFYREAISAFVLPHYRVLGQLGLALAYEYHPGTEVSLQTFVTNTRNRVSATFNSMLDSFIEIAEATRYFALEHARWSERRALRKSDGKPIDEAILHVDKVIGNRHRREGLLAALDRRIPDEMLEVANISEARDFIDAYASCDVARAGLHGILDREIFTHAEAHIPIRGLMRFVRTNTSGPSQEAIETALVYRVLKEAMSRPTLEDATRVLIAGSPNNATIELLRSNLVEYFQLPPSKRPVMDAKTSSGEAIPKQAPDPVTPPAQEPVPHVDIDSIINQLPIKIAQTVEAIDRADIQAVIDFVHKERSLAKSRGDTISDRELYLMLHSRAAGSDATKEDTSKAITLRLLMGDKINGQLPF